MSEGRSAKKMKTIDCNDAESFLQVLKSWAIDHNAVPFEWAFRGQRIADRPLLPAALRPGTKLGFHKDRWQFESKGQAACINQMNGELIAIKQFVALADRVGLPLPGLHQIFRESEFDHHNRGHFADVGGSYDFKGVGTAEWPKPEFLELLAIAQHHGVPTRLLDFTYSSSVAAYFAASGALEKSRGTAEMAVWGINVLRLRKNNHFRVVEVERAKNRFIEAQKGLFVLGMSNKWSNAPSDQITPPLCQTIQERFDPGSDTIFKVTLPTSQASDTLRLLELEGVNRAALMPTYDNVVEYLNSL